MGRYELTLDRTFYIRHADCAVDAIRCLRTELMENQKRVKPIKPCRFDTPIKVRLKT